MRRARAASFALALLATCGLARSAHADPPVALVGAFSIDRFDPAPPGDRFDSVEGAGVDGEELLRAALTLDYARAPLVVRAVPAPVVDHQLVLHASLSLALWETLLLTGSFPIVLVNEGRRVVTAGSPSVVLAAPGSPSLGNLELGFRVRVLGDESRPFAVAFGGTMWLATGHVEEFTGDSKVRGMPYAAISGSLPHFAYAAHVGALVQPALDFVDVHLGPELRFALAGAFVSADERFQIGPELSASIPLVAGSERATALASMELLGSARLRIHDVVIGFAIGPGLVRGVGTPSFRSLSTIAFAPRHEEDTDGDGIIDRFDACKLVRGAPNQDPELDGCPSDRDEDGVLDVDDACPDEPGVPWKDRSRNGCPVPVDRDGDGIPDKSDACPDQRGPSSSDAKKNGCPPDRDGDGILDAEDACPDVPGVDDADAKKKGCPADADGDGIPDSKDACPLRAGDPSDDADKNGCPSTP